jgi:hypothetical protein
MEKSVRAVCSQSIKAGRHMAQYVQRMSVLLLIDHSLHAV